MEIQRLQRKVIDVLENVKAQDIKVFNTTHLTSLFDRVIIANGTSSHHTRSIARSLIKQASTFLVPVITIEGEDSGEWVLVDLGYIVIHLMQVAVRLHYNLEELWGDKPVHVKLLPT